MPSLHPRASVGVKVSFLAKLAEISALDLGTIADLALTPPSAVTTTSLFTNGLGMDEQVLLGSSGEAGVVAIADMGLIVTVKKAIAARARLSVNLRLSHFLRYCMFLLILDVDTSVL